MSDQPAHLDDYPPEGVLSAEAALVAAWSSLENFHSDLVVIGGLAIHFHTRGKAHPQYRPTPTLDVDFGITLGADAGLAAPAAFALSMAGFSEDENGRVYSDSRHGKLFVDFLTEHPPAKSGTRNVSDLKASICPGINRALVTPIKRKISGLDQHGNLREFAIPFSDYGPLIVLKLNAFAQRTTGKRAKDAYDILSLVRSSVDGPEAVVASFGVEKKIENPGLAVALATLEEHFSDADQLGPMLAESFYLGARSTKESGLRLREDMVTVAHALLEA